MVMSIGSDDYSHRHARVAIFIVFVYQLRWLLNSTLMVRIFGFASARVESELPRVASRKQDLPIWTLH